MKHIHSIFFTLIILLHTSCQECSYIENDLHGFWQMTSIEELPSGELMHAQGDLYYSFQRNIVIVGRKAENKPLGVMMGEQYISDFTLTDDSINISDFRIYMDYQEKAPLNQLKKFGIHDENTTFHITQNKQSLIFTSDKARVTLRKY